jgi:pimeloyl-ACP methyl ester carboxylesterase
MTPPLLYLHGLASSPKGRKRSLLADRFAAEGIAVVAPDLNVPSFRDLDFDAMVEAADAAVRKESPRVVVGSSLGALVALAVSRGLGPAGPPLVLVAPAVGFGERWRTKLPSCDPVSMFHHGEGRDLPIHRAFFERMAAVDADSEPPPVPVSVVMGMQDESVPFDHVEATWGDWGASGKLAPGSRFHALDGGDHSLLAFGDEIEAAVRERMR